MNPLIKIDDWLIDVFFQKIIDYSIFKFGINKFLINNLLILIIFFCNCNCYYNDNFLLWLAFTIWLVVEVITTIVDQYIIIDYQNRSRNTNNNIFSRTWITVFFLTTLILYLMIFFFHPLKEMLMKTDSMEYISFEIIFCLAVIIQNYLKYCSNKPKYKFKKKEKKARIYKFMRFAT